jgi:hypothetical protein
VEIHRIQHYQRDPPVAADAGGGEAGGEAPGRRGQFGVAQRAMRVVECRAPTVPRRDMAVEEMPGGIVMGACQLAFLRAAGE